MRAQQFPQCIRLRMTDYKPFQCRIHDWQVMGWMIMANPFNQGWKTIVKGQDPIFRHSHTPAQVTARNLDRAAGRRAKLCQCRIQISHAANPVANARWAAEPVQIKPTRIGRRRGGGVDGNRLDIQTIAASDQSVMGAKSRVLPACGQRLAQSRFGVMCGGSQIRARNSKMIKYHRIPLLNHTFMPQSNENDERFFTAPLSLAKTRAMVQQNIS